jgi:hypothetical protein
MSAERSVSPASRASSLICVVLTVVFDTGCQTNSERRAVVRWAPNGKVVAYAVQTVPCERGACWSVRIGSSVQDAATVQKLADGEECTEIAWTKDSGRVAFVINGYQLRIYDADTRSPAGQITLIQPDEHPPSRIARGVTFSDNGRAVTFDDCPRESSGCRSGFAAVPVAAGK